MRPSTPRVLVPVWLASRALPFLLLVPSVLHENDVRYDVTYYGQRLHDLLHGTSLTDTMREYPLPALLVTGPQYLLTGGDANAFGVLFPLTMLAVDALLCVVLWRAAGGRLSPALAFWLAFVPLLAPMAFYRFDLVPTTVTVAALVLLAGRPALSGGLIAAGTALKIWPAMAAVVAFVQTRTRRAMSLAFAGCTAVVVVAVLAAAGWDRLVSPLRWQFDRGLQVESVPATPILLWRLWHRGDYRTGLSKYQAYEVFGPGVRGAITVSTAVTIAGVLLLAALWVRTWRRPSPPAMAWLLLTAAAVQTVTNKVFSPQYLLWLGGTGLVVLLVADRARAQVAVVLLLAAALSHLVFPVFYDQLVKPRNATAAMTVVLAARNLLVTYLAILGAVQAWRTTRPSLPCAPPVPGAAA